MAESSHIAIVSAWMTRTLDGRGTAEIAPLFGAAMIAIWDRAALPLGEVTLGAIHRRVISRALRDHPVLAAIGLGKAPESFRTLAAHDAECDRGTLLTAIRYVLVELLTLMGTLTAEILTVALHDALSAVNSPAEAPAKPIASKRGVSE